MARDILTTLERQSVEKLRTGEFLKENAALLLLPIIDRIAPPPPSRTERLEQFANDVLNDRLGLDEIKITLRDIMER